MSTSCAQRKPWKYDQFDPELVSIVLTDMLAPCSRAELSDPVLLSRKISAMVNANDDVRSVVAVGLGEVWKGSPAPFLAVDRAAS